METCVLIPPELALVLQARLPRAEPPHYPWPRVPLPEIGVAVWASRALEPGHKLRPDDGEERLDKLEVYQTLPEHDIKKSFGCYDEIVRVDNTNVRHCNWIRFVKSSTNHDDVNVIATKEDDQTIYEVIKTIEPNNELVVMFDTSHEDERTDKVEEAATVSMDCSEFSDDFNALSPSNEASASTDELMTSPESRPTSPIPNESSPEQGQLFKDSSPDQGNFHQESTPKFTHFYKESTPKAKSLYKNSTPDQALLYKDTTPEQGVSSFKESTPEQALSYKESTPEQLKSNSTPEQALAVSKEDGNLPSSDSSLSSGQGTPANDRYPPIWTGFSPASGGAAPCTPHSFTRDNPLPTPGQLPLRRKEKTWLPCDVCGKKFDRPSLLKRHMRTHTGEKPHACDVCGKAFSTSSSLNTHRRIHSGEKPHQCQICGKCFTASSNLYYHRMTHKKEKPHKCNLCSKSFPTPGDLKSHMYVHNGSWPFKCDMCNRGFSKQTNLKNHMLLHTGDKPHVCPVCQKKFALQCNLKTHLKTHEEEGSHCSDCGRAQDKQTLSPSGLCNTCIEHRQKASDKFRMDALVPQRNFQREIPFQTNLPLPFPGSSPPDLPKPHQFFGNSALSSHGLSYPAPILGRPGFGGSLVGSSWTQSHALPPQRY